MNKNNMNAYFFNISPEEKKNILDKHKEVYDGYVTNYIKPNQEPLYVQDFANDKGGITINNKGEVSTYKNTNINEDVYSGAAFEPEKTFEQMDMIGDGEDDFIHGTFDNDDSLEDCEHCGGLGFDEFDEENCEWCGGTGFKDKGLHHYDLEPKFNDIDDLDIDELDIEIIEPLQEQVNKTLDVFRRFKNY